jgi:hypothetical protein
LPGCATPSLGYSAPAPPPLHPDRITFTQLRAAASFDATASRAFWRLMFMLCQPDDVYQDPQIVAHIQHVLNNQGRESPSARLALVGPEQGHIDPLVVQPTHEQLLTALATT